MTEKICPVCNRSNLSTAKRCWYCQSLLEEETVDQGAPESGQAPASGSDSGENEVPEWLARIRQRKAIEEMQQTRSLSPENLPSHEEAAQRLKINLKIKPKIKPHPSSRIQQPFQGGCKEWMLRARLKE